MASVDFVAGGFRTIPAVLQYSAGVEALPGFALRRATFRRPVPLADGFARIEAVLAAAGRPTTAFCACELRSPAPFTEGGFRAFNEGYVEPLKRWGLFEAGFNPVARSNVCPAVDPPAEPSFHAFTYTVEAEAGLPSFVIAGSGEAREGGAAYGDSIVCRGETSPDAVAEKARYVHGEMERRLAVFGRGWADVTATQVYTVHDIHPFLAGDIVGRGAGAGCGLTWHLCRPPVQELEYEMDCRSVAREDVI